MAIGWHAPNEDFDLADRQFKTSDYDDYENDPCVYRADESGPWLLLQCPAGERCPHCNERPGHYGCVVIAVDGACWNNGTDQAQAAGAVYFHDSNNQCNKSFLVPGTKTSQRAELHAGLEALRLANIIRDFNPVLSKAELLEMRPYDPLTKLHQVVIKADSEYLVKGMTIWIDKWRKNGFMTARKTPVANADLFKKIDQEIDKLNQRGVQVQFWHVPRDQNKMADRLATWRLRGVGPEEAMDSILAESDK